MGKAQHATAGVEKEPLALGSGKLNSHMQKMKLDHFLTPYIKIDWKWMKKHNVRKESIIALEERTGSNFFDLSSSNFFLGTS